MGFGECNCDHCEEVMQPYLDRALTPEEHAEAEAHLDGCAYCRKRYRFEIQSCACIVKTACREEMSPELKAKLVALRLPEA